MFSQTFTQAPRALGGNQRGSGQLRRDRRRRRAQRHGRGRLPRPDRREYPGPGGAVRHRWVAALAASPIGGADLFDLLHDYGIPAVRARSAGTLAAGGPCPWSPGHGARLISGLRVAGILAGVRGQPPCDVDAVADVLSFSLLAADRGEHLDALDVNPLICSPSGAVAVDALALPRYR